VSEELGYLSAREAVDRFAARRLSPVELMQALLARAERLSPVYNATAAIHADQALAAAREAEARYQAGTQRPLEGVPVAIKEETSVAGWRRTIGSWLHDEVPAAHHPIVDKLIRAGAIPHLQTTVPEFCVIPQTHSLRFGVTRNPWNPALTPGGSSGGSAAALAAGLAPLATGSDMGGSTRIPAALTGVFGYKPPFGRLASAPGEELFAFAVEGPLARTFDDLVLMQNVIAGPHPATYTGMPYQNLPARYPDLDGARLAVAYPTRGRPLCADTRRNLETACAVLQGVGARIEPVELDWDPAELGGVLIEAIFGLYFDEFLEAFGEAELARATPYLRWLVGRHRGRRNSIMRAAALASRLHQELNDKLWSRGTQALLCPTVLTTTVPADLDISRERTVEIGGVAVDSYLGWVFTQPFNLLSRYPALAVPTGRATSGVPTSLQIVGPPFGDETVFAVAFHHAAAAGLDLYRSAFPALPAAT
jgi:amidase